MKKLSLFNACFIVVLLFGASSAFAQRESDTGVSVDKDVALLRRDLRAEKKQIIAANMSFTEAEATKFWPVYDQYAAEMGKVNDEFYGIVKEYVTVQKTLTDAQAVALMKRWAESQQKQVATRAKYVPIFEKTIPATKAALFLQVDRRLYTLMDLQTSTELPLIIH
jgi:hypothetical protein